MADPEALAREIEEQTERSLRGLGELEERVVGAMAPQRIGDTLVAWPRRALGRLRIVRRARGVLYVTDGLSLPFDPSMHGEGREPLGFELGIEVAAEDVGRTSEERARAWTVPALLWLSACYVLDDFRLLDLVDRFGLATQILPPDPVLAHLVLDDGSVGALAGMPLAPTSTFGRASQHLLAAAGGLESRLVILTAITPDECTWARGVHDGARTMELAKALWLRGHGHLTLPRRASCLPLA